MEEPVEKTSGVVPEKGKEGARRASGIPFSGAGSSRQKGRDFLRQ